jgi:hypothetical protein
MRNPLCLVGRHEWVERATDDGERYRECRRCGTVKDDDLPPDFGLSANLPGGG